MTVTLEEIKQKQTELEALIRAFEEQEEEAEFPKLNDLYYFINRNGSIYPETYELSYDEEAYSIGNCFRTQEEAEFAVEQLKVIAEMRRCGGEFEYKRSTCRGEAFSFFIKYFDGEISVCSVDSFWAATKMWFPTEEAAQKAIDAIGGEHLLKYWFCVEVEE